MSRILRITLEYNVLYVVPDRDNTYMHTSQGGHQEYSRYKHSSASAHNWAPEFVRISNSDLSEC